MDAGCTARRAARLAYGQAVWSSPLDAGVKFAEMIGERRGLTSPIPRGERGVSRKAIAQGVPDRFGEPVVTLLVGRLPFLPTRLRVR